MVMTNCGRGYCYQADCVRCGPTMNIPKMRRAAGRWPLGQPSDPSERGVLQRVRRMLDQGSGLAVSVVRGFIGTYRE